MRIHGLAALAFALTGCLFDMSTDAGTHDGPVADAGPRAIVNGASLGGAGTHRVGKSSSECPISYGVQIELTGDGAFKSIVGGPNGPSTCTGTWTASGNGASALMATTCVAGPYGYHASVSGLINIAGSTDSAGFACGLNVADGLNAGGNLCVFNLAAGGL